MDKKIYSLSLNKEHMKSIKELAVKDGRSVAGYIRNMIKKEVEKLQEV